MVIIPANVLSVPLPLEGVEELPEPPEPITIGYDWAERNLFVQTTTPPAPPPPPHWLPLPVPPPPPATTIISADPA